MKHQKTIFASVLFAITLALWANHPVSAEEVEADKQLIIEDLRNNSLSSEEIRQISNVPELAVVSLDDASGAFLEKLMEVLANTEDNFAETRTAIEVNPAMEFSLRQQGVELRDVIAATRSDSGNLTIYINGPELNE